MNSYDVIKSDHKFGMKDGKKWSLLTVYVDVSGGIAVLKFWDVDPQTMPRAGDQIFIKYELKSNAERVWGKPVGFEKV